MNSQVLAEEWAFPEGPLKAWNQKEIDMKWRQFFTPVKSYDAEQAKEFVSKLPPSKLTILDVRQPKEYESGHIPGATLIPVGDLKNRSDELDPEKPTLVY